MYLVRSSSSSTIMHTFRETNGLSSPGLLMPSAILIDHLLFLVHIHFSKYFYAHSSKLPNLHYRLPDAKLQCDTQAEKKYLSLEQLGGVLKFLSGKFPGNDQSSLGEGALQPWVKSGDAKDGDLNSVGDLTLILCRGSATAACISNISQDWLPKLISGTTR